MAVKALDIKNRKAAMPDPQCPSPLVAFSLSISNHVSEASQEMPEIGTKEKKKRKNRKKK
jgi:hypothetical protein